MVSVSFCTEVDWQIINFRRKIKDSNTISSFPIPKISLGACQCQLCFNIKLAWLEKPASYHVRRNIFQCWIGTLTKSQDSNHLLSVDRSSWFGHSSRYGVWHTQCLAASVAALWRFQSPTTSVDHSFGQSWRCSVRYAQCLCRCVAGTMM